MQRALFLVALVAVPAAMAMGEKEAKALVARVWLRAHDSKPNVDELAELKDQNPEAYAIVKALLTKRSLGLLDPHHPTASFARGPSSDADEVPRGPAVFAKFASKTELAKMNAVSAASDADTSADVDVAQPVMSHPHRDFLNWKPSNDDDAMVKNVLGSVAELTSKPQSRSLIGQSRGEVTEVAPPPVVAAPVVAAPRVEAVAPAAPAASEESNNYLDSIGGFGLDDAKPKPALIKQTSQDSKNFLDSFSWDDSKKATTKTESSAAAEASPLMADAADLMPEAPAATTAAPAKSAGGNSGSALMKWLR